MPSETVKDPSDRRETKATSMAESEANPPSVYFPSSLEAFPGDLGRVGEQDVGALMADAPDLPVGRLSQEGFCLVHR